MGAGRMSRAGEVGGNQTGIKPASERLRREWRTEWLKTGFAPLLGPCRCGMIELVQHVSLSERW